MLLKTFCFIFKTLCLQTNTIMQTLFIIVAVADNFVRKAEKLCRLDCDIKLNMHALLPFIYRHFRDAVQVYYTFLFFFSEIFLGGYCTYLENSLYLCTEYELII